MADRKAYMKEWHAKHREEQKSKRAEWRATRGQTEEQKAKARERAKRWYYANRERALAADVEYKRKCPEIRKKANANYAASPKGRLYHVLNEGKRRARKAQASAERIDVRVLLEQHNGRCSICDVPLDTNFEKYHIDHIIPLAAGGAHTMANLQVVHPTCNLRKGAKVAA